MQHWEFAIYKYSDERYDPEEWIFPGAEEVDGTIEGAMRAGLKAYPSMTCRDAATPPSEPRSRCCASRRSRDARWSGK